MNFMFFSCSSPAPRAPAPAAPRAWSAGPALERPKLRLEPTVLRELLLEHRAFAFGRCARVERFGARGLRRGFRVGGANQILRDARPLERRRFGKSRVHVVAGVAHAGGALEEI